MYARDNRNEAGLGIAPAIIGAGISVASKLAKSLFGGRTGAEVAEDITKKYTASVAKAAHSGDTQAGPYMGARAGTIAPYTMPKDFNYYPKGDKDYSQYQGHAGGVANPVTDPALNPYWRNGYYALYTEGLAPAPGYEQPAGSYWSPGSAEAVGAPPAATVSGGYSTLTNPVVAGVSPLMIAIGVGSAVMLSSLFKR